MWSSRKKEFELVGEGDTERGETGATLVLAFAFAFFFFFFAARHCCLWPFHAASWQAWSQ